MLAYLFLYDRSSLKFGPDLPIFFKMHEIWPDESQENYLNCCHQMSDFKAKMHQIRFRLGLRPIEPAAGAYSARPDPLAGFKGPTSKGREGEGEGRDGRGGPLLSVCCPLWLRKLDPPLPAVETVHKCNGQLT